MPAAIMLKNIPDDIYRRLKEVAETHHRSLSSEAIACLESVLLPRVTPHERLQRARQLRAAVKSTGKVPNAADLAKAIQLGRA